MWKNVMVKPRHPHTGAIGHQGEGSFNQKKKKNENGIREEISLPERREPSKKVFERGTQLQRPPPPIIRKKVLFVSIRLFKIRRFLSATVDPRRCFATGKKNKIKRILCECDSPVYLGCRAPTSRPFVIHRRPPVVIRSFQLPLPTISQRFFFFFFFFCFVASK